MKKFAIKYTEEITEEIFNKLIKHLLSIGYYKGDNWTRGDWGFAGFKKGGWLRTNTVTEASLSLDVENLSVKECSIWDFIKKEERPFKEGDWVWNSEDGVMQIREINLEQETFSAVGKREEKFYYTLHTKGSSPSICYTRHALPHEIPIKPETMETFKIGDYVEITKSSYNWASEMDQYVGKVVKLIHTEGSNRFRINEDGGRWIWVYGDGHFKSASAPIPSLLDEARKRYPKGTNYKCAANFEYSHVVEDPALFTECAPDIIHGEVGKGYLYIRGKWAEIVKEESLPIEKARILFPEGTQFNNGNLIGYSMNTYVSSGAFRKSGREILVIATNGHNYTLYKEGKWADIIVEKEEDKYEKINKLFPVGAVFISPENGREYKRCSGTPWVGNGDDVLVPTMGGIGQYIKFKGKYATLALPRYTAESSPSCSSPGIERMPTEIAMKKKPVKRRQLM